ncbi:MAG: efflux RND transporter periplasmic adaptor subunit [Azoarcus sp.]|nr:efflux RND transporter periplasmic adaptor subunit [Azoarcus sp.]
MVTLFIGYGIYVNMLSSSHIETMMQNRAVRLSGSTVAWRQIRPEIRIAYAGMRAAGQTDAITEVDGTVEMMFVKPGQKVKRGEKLFQISNDEIELSIARANTDIAKANVAYKNAASKVEKLRWLVSRDSISKGELENAEAGMEAAKAELDAFRIVKSQLERQMRLQVVTAPISGVVMLIYKPVGNFVSQGTPILMISDIKERLILTTMLEDKQVKNLVPLDEKLTLHMDLLNMTENAFESQVTASFNEETSFDIRITAISPPIELDAPRRTVTLEVGNEGGLMEFGIYTDMIVRKEDPVRVLAIPLNTLADRNRVYVESKDGRLGMREVETGVYDDRFIEVRGLPEGKIVIVAADVAGLNENDRIEVSVEED